MSHFSNSTDMMVYDVKTNVLNITLNSSLVQDSWGNNLINITLTDKKGGLSLYPLDLKILKWMP